MLGLCDDDEGGFGLVRLLSLGFENECVSDLVSLMLLVVVLVNCLRLWLLLLLLLLLGE